MFDLFGLIFVLESMKKVETYCCNVFSGDIPKNCLEVSLFDLDEKCTLPEWMTISQHNANELETILRKRLHI